MLYFWIYAWSMQPLFKEKKKSQLKLVTEFCLMKPIPVTLTSYVMPKTRNYTL